MDKYAHVKQEADFNTHEEVSKQAYFYWLNSGCPENRSLEFWLQAEKYLCPSENLIDEPKCRWCRDRGWVYGESESRPYGESCPMCETKK